MAGDESNLRHDEVWDDSALIDSWNDALKEYEKYHSVYTKGGQLRELINDSETAKSNIKPESQDEEEDEAQPATSQVTGGVASESKQTSQAVDDKPQQNIGRNAAPLPSFPPGLPGSVGDENFKKLLMSWYYAGYYTGLFEGQQQPRAEQ